MSDEFEAQALDVQDRIATMTDDQVRRAYLECDADCGDPYLEALVDALIDRNIDI